jgi:hypothetical protein
MQSDENSGFTFEPPLGVRDEAAARSRILAYVINMQIYMKYIMTGTFPL